MPYLNLDLAFPRHRKTRRLVGLLGRGAEILLIRLWSYCGEHHCEDGTLHGYSDQEVEAIVEWWGEQGLAVEAMVKVGLLDRAEGGDLAVHDWLEHSGHLAAMKKRGRSNAKKRWGDIADGVNGNASSNAGSISHTDASSNAGRNAPAIPAKPSNPAQPTMLQTPGGRLAVKWLHKRPVHTDHDRQANVFFDDLVAAGVAELEVDKAIDSCSKSEPIWDFCKRIDPRRKSNGNTGSGHLGPGRVPVTSEALEQNAERRAAQAAREAAS